jgi:hypothetical protein
MWHRLPRRSGVLVTGLALLASSTPALSATDQHGRVVRVVGRLHATSDAVPDTSLCDAQPDGYAVGPADVPESGTSTLTGTFAGTGRFCGHTTRGLGPGGSLPFVETDVFTGTVHGCGTGSATYRVRGYVGSSYSTARNGLPTEEDWQVVAGSGTAGLRGLTSGGGHDSGAIHPDTSIDTDFTGSVRCARNSPPGEQHRSYTTVLTGDWYSTGCVPTSVPPSASFPMRLAGVCTGSADGSWTGVEVDHAVGVLGSDLGLRSVDDIRLYGRASDGTCGSLHIRQTITVDGTTSALKGVATILSGSGDWVGSTGTYTTDGVFNGGVGNGTYAGQWRRPAPPKQVAAQDCRP